jgi:hypothetical protein
MELHEYTTEDLKAELCRRRYEKNGEWYYVYEDEDEEDPEWRAEIPNFIFIHKRMYHLQHKVQETNIAKFLKLPKHFSEHRASNFEYHSGRYNGGKKDPAKHAKKLLDQHGFIQLKNPVLGDESVVMHNFEVADRRKGFGIEWHVEREDLKLMLDNFLINHPWAESVKLAEYIEECKAFASVHGCVAYFYNFREAYMDAAFLPGDIFYSLPKNIFGRKEGEE